MWRFCRNQCGGVRFECLEIDSGIETDRDSCFWTPVAASYGAGRALALINLD